MADGERLERQSALRRERQRRFRRRVNSHQTCSTIIVGEDGLQALVYAGLLPEDRAHRRDAIAVAAQALFDRSVAEELEKSGLV